MDGVRGLAPDGVSYATKALDKLLEESKHARVVEELRIDHEGGTWACLEVVELYGVPAIYAHHSQGEAVIVTLTSEHVQRLREALRWADPSSRT